MEPDPPLPPVRMLDVGGVRVRHAKAGQGPPLLLLHGLGATAYSWRRVWRALSASREVHLFDWPGHGRSDKPAGFDYSPRGYSAFLEALLDRLGLAAPDLVGNSLGGLVALVTALERPERAGRIVLIGTPTYLDSRPRFLWTLRRPVAGRVFEWCLGKWLVRWCCRDVFIDRSVVTPELIEEYSQALRTRAGRRAIADFVRHAVPPDADALMARYRDLPRPALLLLGEFDCMVRRQDAERFVREAPEARLVGLPGCGHAPQEEKPELVASEIDAFLARSPRRAPH